MTNINWIAKYIFFRFTNAVQRPCTVVHTQLLKKCGEALVKPLTIMFKKSIRTEDYQLHERQQIF